MFNERLLREPLKEDIEFHSKYNTFCIRRQANQAAVQTGYEHDAITGCSLIHDFITITEQDEIIEIIDGNNWSNVLKRRQQFYGKVYFYTKVSKKTLI
jgi:hypothetical protein